MRSNTQTQGDQIHTHSTARDPHLAHSRALMCWCSAAEQTATDSVLQNSVFIISWFPWAWSPGMAELGVRGRSQGGGWLGCVLIWWLEWGQILFQAHSGCWPNAFLCGLRLRAQLFAGCWMKTVPVLCASSAWPFTSSSQQGEFL